MSSSLAVGGAPSAYWYLTRSTGAVALILLTGSLALGVADVRRFATTRWPRFVIDGLHRNVSLLAVVFVVLHVLTSVLDGFAPISLTAAVIPFTSSYRPFWLGLGAVSFDLLLALIITSLLRGRIGHRTWRITHWCAYACWPIALVHSFGTGSDARSAWLLLLSIACIAVVSLAILSRALPEFARAPASEQRRAGRRRRVRALLDHLAAQRPAREGLGAPRGHARLAARPFAVLDRLGLLRLLARRCHEHREYRWRGSHGGGAVSTQAYAPPASLPRLLEGVPAVGAMSLEQHLATHGELPGGRAGPAAVRSRSSTRSRRPT